MVSTWYSESGSPGARYRAKEARAKEAFRRLERGKAHKDDRETVLLSAFYSYMLAREVEKSPSDDTRASASKEAAWAFGYANNVDHEDHEITRKGVQGSTLYKSMYDETFGQEETDD